MKRRSKGDKAAARELILFAENESSIYPQRVSIHKNLLKKIKKGQYSDTKAAKLWGYWFEVAAKSYARQMANPGDWNRIFSAATRRLAARSYASSEGRILKAAARGETDEYVYSNPRKKYANSFQHRREFRRLSREALRDARRWAKDHGKDDKYKAIVSRAREWSRESFARKNPKRRTQWNGRRQMLLNQLRRFPQAKNRLAYSDPQYEAKRKTLLLMRKQGLVTLEFNFPHNDDIYYTATEKVVRSNLRARSNPSAFIVVARGRGARLFYDGKKFTTKGRPKVFGSMARARTKANELANKYRALDNYGVFPVAYDPKS